MSDQHKQCDGLDLSFMYFIVHTLRGKFDKLDSQWYSPEPIIKEVRNVYELLKYTKSIDGKTFWRMIDKIFKKHNI